MLRQRGKSTNGATQGRWRRRRRRTGMELVSRRNAQQAILVAEGVAAAQTSLVVPVGDGGLRQAAEGGSDKGGKR